MSKPTTVAECAEQIGYMTRRIAIYRMNMLTKQTDEQHDIVKLKDPATGEMLWYVYNRVPVEFRMKAILPR